MSCIEHKTSDVRHRNSCRMSLESTVSSANAMSAIMRSELQTHRAQLPKEQIPDGGLQEIRLMKFIGLLAIGGTERQVVNIGKGLDETRFRVHLACLQRKGELLAECEALSWPIAEYKIKCLYGYDTLKKQIKFGRDLRGQGMRIVHTYGFYPNVFAVPAARCAGIPVIIGALQFSPGIDGGGYAGRRDTCRRQSRSCRRWRERLVGSSRQRRSSRWCNLPSIGKPNDDQESRSRRKGAGVCPVCAGSSCCRDRALIWRAPGSQDATEAAFVTVVRLTDLRSFPISMEAA